MVTPTLDFLFLDASMPQENSHQSYAYLLVGEIGDGASEWPLKETSGNNYRANSIASLMRNHAQMKHKSAPRGDN